MTDFDIVRNAISSAPEGKSSHFGAFISIDVYPPRTAVSFRTRRSRGLSAASFRLPANNATVLKLVGNCRQGSLQENCRPEVALMRVGKIELNVRPWWLQGLIVVHKNGERRPERLGREIRVAVGGEAGPVFFHRSRQLLLSCSQICAKREKELKLVGVGCAVGKGGRRQRGHRGLLIVEFVAEGRHLKRCQLQR